MARRWQSHKHPEKLKTRDPLITTEKTWVPGHHGNAVRDHSNSSALWRNSSPPMCTQTSPFPHPTPVHTPKRHQRIHHRHPTSVNTLISTSALLGCQEHNDTPQLNSSWWWIHQPQGSGQELEKWSVPRATVADSTHFPEWMLVLCRKLCPLLLDTWYAASSRLVIHWCLSHSGRDTAPSTVQTCLNRGGGGLDYSRRPILSGTLFSGELHHSSLVITVCFFRRTQNHLKLQESPRKVLKRPPRPPSPTINLKGWQPYSEWQSLQYLPSDQLWHPTMTFSKP